MDHPFLKLKPEYSQLLSMMVVRPECRERVNNVTTQILGFRSRFEEITKANAVPVVFIGPSFYREADLNFKLNPAQGWPLTSRSKIIPHNGPFPDWKTAAIAAYHLNGLDQIGAGNWTWELICFYAEMFNGFGYRDFHHMHSPYLWGGTNIQTVGKYTNDGQFDAEHWDSQLGVIPLAKRMAEIMPELAITGAIPAPVSSGLAVSENPMHNVSWLQTSLHELGFELAVDGSYGRETKQAVRTFQTEYGLRVDGYAGPETLGAVDRALFAFKHDEPRPALLPPPNEKVG